MNHKNEHYAEPLNLPPCNLQLRGRVSGKTDVYDPLRAKWVAYTPEERVRQHFLHFMTGSLGYMPGRMAVETGISLNGTRRRVDALVYDDYGLPLMIVEFKAPQVTVTQAVFNQIVRYNLVLRVPYLTVSNGLKHYCCKVDMATGRYEFLTGMPRYDEIRNRVTPDGPPVSAGL